MRLVILAASTLCVAGCAPLSAITGGPSQSENAAALKVLSDHIESCDRRYQGGIGVGGGFTFSIDCKAQLPKD